MANKIYTKENLHRVSQLFGPEIGRTPLISSELTNEAGTVFWADETVWGLKKLRNMSYPRFKVFGPFLREATPFNSYIPPCDGFVIFVPDKD